MIPVLILAAGTSSRMRGRDKLMMDVRGQPLLRRQIERATGIGPVYVALPSADHPRIQALDGTQAKPVFVPRAAEGMGSTIRDAVVQLPKGGPFMMVLGDLISLENKDLMSILHVMNTHQNYLIWRGATANGKAGHPIIFHESLLPKFADLGGDDGAQSIVKPLMSQTYLHRFDDNRARHDLDTPEDWTAWRNSLIE